MSEKEPIQESNTEVIKSLNQKIADKISGLKQEILSSEIFLERVRTELIDLNKQLEFLKISKEDKFAIGDVEGEIENVNRVISRSEDNLMKKKYALEILEEIQS